MYDVTIIVIIILIFCIFCGNGFMKLNTEQQKNVIDGVVHVSYYVLCAYFLWLVCSNSQTPIIEITTNSNQTPIMDNR